MLLKYLIIEKQFEVQGTGTSTGVCGVVNAFADFKLRNTSGSHHSNYSPLVGTGRHWSPLLPSGPQSISKRASRKHILGWV